MISLTPPWNVPNKNLLQGAFFCCFRHGMAGMSRRRVIWVGTSRNQKNFMQENFGLIFVPHKAGSFCPKKQVCTRSCEGAEIERSSACKLQGQGRDL